MSGESLRGYIKYYFEMYDYMKNNLNEEAPLPPLNIYMEPINLCNLNCPFCATQSIRRKRQVMDFMVFRKAIDDIVAKDWQGIVRLSLTGHGEPLLNREIVKMVRYAKDSGFLSVDLITNGTLLSKETSIALLEAGLDRIQFSIDSIRETTYSQLRRPKSKKVSYFARTMRNILCFLLRNEEVGHRAYVSISAILTTINRSEREEFLEFWEDLPVDNVAFPPLSTLQNSNEMEESSRFDGDMSTKPLCVIPWISLSVKSNGDVTICSHDFHSRYPLGNISDNKLDIMWNNERARRLRSSLIRCDTRYFVSIGHDCYSCNNPCIGYGKNEFVTNLPNYMEKTILGHIVKDNRVDELKLGRLRKLMEAYA